MATCIFKPFSVAVPWSSNSSLKPKERQKSCNSLKSKKLPKASNLMALKRPSNWRASRLLLLLLFYTLPQQLVSTFIFLSEVTRDELFSFLKTIEFPKILYFFHTSSSSTPQQCSVHLKYTSCSHDSDELACFLPRVCVYVWFLFIERPLLTLLNAPISLIIKNPRAPHSPTTSVFVVVDVLIIF